MDTIQSYPYDAVLGDIGIINGWIITPNGNAPLQGAQWIVADRTWTYSYLSTSSAIPGFLLLCIPFIGWILAIPVMFSQTTAVTRAEFGGRHALRFSKLVKMGLLRLSRWDDL